MYLSHIASTDYISGIRTTGIPNPSLRRAHVEITPIQCYGRILNPILVRIPPKFTQWTESLARQNLYYYLIKFT